MTLQATPAEPVVLYYCKANLKTGLTVRLLLHTGQIFETAGVEFTGARGSMIHGNSKGTPKKSGARCVLQLTHGTITTIPKPV